MRPGSHSFWLWSALACSACSNPAPSAAAPDAAPAHVQASPERPATPAVSARKDVAGDAAAAPGSRPDPRVSTTPKQLANVAATPRSCARAEDIKLRDDAALALLPSQDTTLEVLVLRGDRKTLEWWSGQVGGAAKLRASQALVSKAARVSVVRKAASLYTVALVDEAANVIVLRYEAGVWAAPKTIAARADTRFAPALFEQGSVSLVAYTAAVDGVMHSFVSRSTGSAVDVTPAGHGAAAPAFVVAAREPILVVIDARAGVSPLLEVPFELAGEARAASVRTPVSQPYAPPLLRAVLVPEGEIEVAFTAVGKLAATAIGRVPLRRALPAVPLHPSRGYGELFFDVAVSGRAVVYALEVPVDEKPKAAHLIEIKWLDAQGEGGSLQLTAGSAASSPSIASTPLPGELLVGYVAQQAAHVARLRCDF